MKLTKKLVCEFLHIFSRFEYALKKTNFLKKGSGNNAEADWDKFATSLGKKTSLGAVSSTEFKSSVIYFFTNPPMKQIVDDNNNLSWKGDPISKNQYDFKELLVLVRRVRNNLFHGGKFPNGDVEDSERDERLIKFGMIILEECLRLDSVVEREFRKEIFNVYEN